MTLPKKVISRGYIEGLVKETIYNELTCTCKTFTWAKPEDARFCSHIEWVVANGHDAPLKSTTPEVIVFDKPAVVATIMLANPDSQGFREADLRIDKTVDHLGLVGPNDGRRLLRLYMLDWLEAAYEKRPPCQGDYCSKIYRELAGRARPLFPSVAADTWSLYWTELCVDCQFNDGIRPNEQQVSATPGSPSTSHVTHERNITK